MKKIILFLLVFILNFTVIKCGLPSPESVQSLNTPVILTGTKTANGDGTFNYSEINKGNDGNPYITIKISAYQPEGDVSGFNIYIANNIDEAAPTSAIQNAHSQHFYYNTSTGTYSYQSSVEAKYIISNGTPTSGSYPTITMSDTGVYPAIQSGFQEFTYTIRWDGKADYLISNQIYHIAVCAVDIAGKIESKLSNIIQVNANPSAGDPDF